MEEKLLSKQDLDTLTAAVKTEAQKAIETYNANPNEHTKALMDTTKSHADQITAMALEVKNMGTQVSVIDGILTKFAKAGGMVSIKELGGGKAELDLDKAKVFRGIITKNWAGADKEKAVIDACNQRAIETGGVTNAGSVIPVELSTNIVNLVRERNILTELGVLNVNPMRMRFEIPTVTDGTTAYFTGEAKQIQESAMKFGVISMDPKKLAALAFASREMIDSADPAIVPIIESDLATAISEKQMWAAFYGNNAANTPLGLANVPGIKTFEVAAGGDDPSRANLRAIRALVPQKFNSNPSFRFAMNETIAQKIAALYETAAPEAAGMMSDEDIIKRACGKPFSLSGMLEADKSKGGTNKLGDIFYGPWNEFVQAIWWGGLRIDTTTEGGTAWTNDLYGFRAILPMNFAPRRPEVFVHAKYMKSINS